MALYIGGLGFYSDDWRIMGQLASWPNQSLSGLMSSYRRLDTMRPFETDYYAIIYSFAGLTPFPYHVVNGLSFTLAALTLYIALREVTDHRLTSLTVTLIYATMPHYSTNRFWIGCFQTNISMTLCFIAVYLGARAARQEYLRRNVLISLSVLAAVASTLWYELAVPLLLLAPPLVFLAYYTRQQSRSLNTHVLGSFSLFALCNTLALAAVVWFKISRTQRAVLPADYLHYVIDLAAGAVTVNYGWYGFALPRVMWTIFRNYLAMSALLMAITVGGVAAIYVYRAVDSYSSIANKIMAARTVVAGIALFVLGYAIFLTNNNVGFTPTGQANRTAMVAAVGVALSIVGVGMWGISFSRSSKSQRLCFCTFIALYCASGVLINNTIASFWIAANHEQQALLAEIRTEFPVLPSGTSLLLSGACRYAGPGIVFESPMELTGALAALYGDSSLRGAIVTPAFEVHDDSLSVVVYAREYRFPYGRLVIYNHRSGERVSIDDRAAAETFFQTEGGALRDTCPPSGPEGYGVRIF
ncbi:MAG TPA: hypothetical protein VII06_23095 [Chloroflexota bacterium]|jgi:hypothetical protein